jgi:hypothetical protein
VGQDLDKLSVGHHELGDQVDVIVTVLSKIFSGSIAVAKLFEELKVIFTRNQI